MEWLVESREHHILRKRGLRDTSRFSNCKVETGRNALCYREPPACLIHAPEMPPCVEERDAAQRCDCRPRYPASS
jgi:hypothetical protein